LRKKGRKKATRRKGESAKLKRRKKSPKGDLRFELSARGKRLPKESPGQKEESALSCSGKKGNIRSLYSVGYRRREKRRLA